MQRNANKYHARRVGCYDSQAEADYGRLLMLLRQAGEIKDFRHHPDPVRLPGGIKWKVDFCVRRNFGRYLYVEVKGMETADFKLKLQLYRAGFESGAFHVPLLVVRKAGEMKFTAIHQIGDCRFETGKEVE